jgi:hypothetical protein
MFVDCIIQVGCPQKVPCIEITLVVNVGYYTSRNIKCFWRTATQTCAVINTSVVHVPFHSILKGIAMMFNNKRADFYRENFLLGHPVDTASKEY